MTIPSPLEPRVGIGFDVHAFAETPAEAVILGGIAVPHDRALSGHSDADVVLHALCDALYGALAEGDIGHHFPPSDDQWKGMDSAVFLRHAVQRVVARGARLVNADITLICERPKVGPHRDAMRTRIADLLEVNQARVSVKATTTERLGFTGRREGIACQVAVSLLVPEILV